MTAPARQFHLGMFLFAYGHHRAAWRLPQAPTLGPYDLKRLHSDVQALERAKFDFLFMGDTYYAAPVSTPSTVARLEPFTWLANLAAVTSRIGLVATASTTYNHPFHIARLSASLDHLSDGRAGLNIVTSHDQWAGRNFGIKNVISAEARWSRANEFVEVLHGLWDSIDTDALIRDRAGGHFVDWNKVHTIEHLGKHFQVQGPLNCARPPQGHPIQVQAGTSEYAHEFAARFTEVFFAGVSDLVEGKAYYAQLKARLGRYGRQRNELKILPAVAPYIAETKKEAQKAYDTLNDLLDGNLNLTALSELFEVDLSEEKLDGPLPLSRIPLHVATKRWAAPLIRRAREEELTIRQLAYARQASLFGHLVLIGSAKDIADTMQRWFEEDACDGFNICPPYIPDSLDNFLAGVVPELQRRGLFRTEYTGVTARDHLGLSRPQNQFHLREAAIERELQSALR